MERPKSGNRLIKIKVFYYAGSWLLRPFADSKGKRGAYALADSFLFKGSRDEFKHLLSQLSAKDADIAPISQMNISYDELVDELEQGYASFFYVYARDWSKRFDIMKFIQDSRSERGDNA